MSTTPAFPGDPTAVVGRRVGAFVIDFLITGVLYWALFFLFAERRADSPDESIQANLTLGDTTWAITGGKAALFILIFIIVGLAYWAVLPGLTGWTVGKLTTGIRVVGPDGSVPSGAGRNLIRQLVGIVDYFPYFLPGLTGFIIALAAGGHRRLGDMAAKTYVVRRGAAGRPVPVAGASAATAPDSARTTGVAATAASTPGVAAMAQPGWYPDPSGQARLRWWDGRAWTDHTSA